MPHENIRNSGIRFLRHFLQSVHIPHYYGSRILLTKIAVIFPFDRRFSMSQMILAGNHNTPVRQKPGELFITVRIFRHTVYYLNNADRSVRLRCPPKGVDFRPVISGRKIEFFFFHKRHLLSVKMIFIF